MRSKMRKSVPNWFMKSNKKCWTHVMHNDEAKCYFGWIKEKEAYVLFRKMNVLATVPMIVIVIMLIFVLKLAK